MAVEYKDKKASELVELLKNHKGERQVVILQDYPDPDAISSAMAWRFIAREYDIETDIFYSERISHQENLALINLLNIDITRWEGEPFPEKRYKHAILIDTQGTNTKLADQIEAANIPVLAIIDHHV
ncbi:MAG: bifunctional oligoribonuclease/PAP phosphatase NrnA, partial [Magnetococcales bacterium]|nr:bifunctional oligoribonuclease/PAP phosphatase NrnA [Magnetococcales bacterium]